MPCIEVPIRLVTFRPDTRIVSDTCCAKLAFMTLTHLKSQTLQRVISVKTINILTSYQRRKTIFFQKFPPPQKRDTVIYDNVSYRIGHRYPYLDKLDKHSLTSCSRYVVSEGTSAVSCNCAWNHSYTILYLNNPICQARIYVFRLYTSWRSRNHYNGPYMA